MGTSTIPPSGKRRIVPGDARPASWASFFAFAGAVVATMIAFKPLTPVIYAATVYPFFRGNMRQRALHRNLALLIRWSIALFVSVLLIGAFAAPRLIASMPGGAAVAEATAEWIAGDAGPPASWLYLLVGAAVVTAGAVATGGVVGIVALSIGIGLAGISAVHVFQHSNNLLQAALVALPIWHLLALGAVVIWLGPASLQLYERKGWVERVTEDRNATARMWRIGAALLVAGVLLSLILGGLWARILRAWTVQ